MRRFIVPIFVLTLAGCATAPAPSTESDPLDLSDLFSGGVATGGELETLVANAAKYPLGSKENPVRVHMPDGQRAYLSRLRCSDGKAPQFVRIGNFGFGVFKSIIDGYDVRCGTGGPAQSVIYMDMYHPKHRERAAPVGFSIAPG